jgi:hypothetical protein
MINLNLGAGVLCDDLDADCTAAFFLAAAFTGRTPAGRPLDWLDIVARDEVSVRGQ